MQKKGKKKTIVYACRKGEKYPGLVLDRYMNSNFEEKIL
jgi:succinate dehydrogenase flavin-adding protein (antitoxin of CptAB toxin-antitoxin module)